MDSQSPANPQVSPDEKSRLIVYHQTHHGPDDGPPVSLIPLMTRNTGITHVIIAAIHLNQEPGEVALNDHPPSHPRFATLWNETAWLRASGVKILGMLGASGSGTFTHLDTPDDARFNSYYLPLRDMIRTYRLDGIDLDIEVPMKLVHAIRLIDRLRSDFGRDFLITLAPVATAMLVGQPHLSGPEFDYHVLEAMRGHEIAWYNVQFYNGWGDASSTAWYEAVLLTGWKPNKIVLGVLTNPANGGSGFVDAEQLKNTVLALRRRHAAFGGVMGWEYFNGLPGGTSQPWEWVEAVSKALRMSLPLPPVFPPDIVSTGSLPAPMHPYPAESVRTLQDLGFSTQQAIAALNSTNGNVEYAAGLLFQE